jgi:flagellar biosynthesis/type III secretory pathway protein FliH
MIRARLVTTRPSADISFESFRNTITLGRAAICQERKRSRNKACRYAKFIRSRGFTTGYAEGLATAQAECTAALHAIRSCYEDAVDSARGDTHALAIALAERIIDSALRERPELLLAWIQESLLILKRSRSLHLTFQPQYRGVMQHISKDLPNGITVQEDPSLTDADFIISNEHGGVEFSWRDTLHELATDRSCEAR